jgi:hypothetical protein
MDRLLFGFVACLALASLTAAASADFIIYGTNTDHAIVPGASLSDVRMRVDLSVAGGQAIVTFTNVSAAPEVSVVFKEIVIDTLDDDTATAILWNPAILTHTGGVSYSLARYNGLPGYPQLHDDTGMVELQADSPSPQQGIGIGEQLQVAFSTSLADGSAIGDYLAAFGGEDSAFGSIGFHGISASILNGESLSGVADPGSPAVPEPAAASLLVLGGAALLARRRRREKSI